VDEELSDYFSQVADDSRVLWLGGEILDRSDEEPTGLDPVKDARPSFVILCDPTCKRLNTLTSRLAAQAGDLAGSGIPVTAGRLATGASQLRLWESRSNGGFSGSDGVAETERSAAGEYGYCAEAASLLLSEDIPSSLTRLESPLARAEQAAREELASIEGRLTLNQYELARSRLEVQRRILSSLNRRGRLAGLLDRVDVQLERVAYLQSQSEQLDLQRTCGSLICGVEQFCRLTDLCRAQREHDDLVRRLRQVQSGLEPQAGKEVAVLLDELAARLDRHLRRLRRLEIRKSIRNPMRTLRQNWPQDWASPVPEAVRQALAQCQGSDPQGCVEDWVAMKDRLDGHQGQHHLHKAMTVLQAGSASWDSVEGELAHALVCKPDLWPEMASLFGLYSSPSWRDLPESAACAFDAASQPAGQNGFMPRVGGLLERVFPQMQGRANRCLELWQCVAATLSPMLEREDLDAIAQIRGLAERCLDHWPMGMIGLPGRVDPRNPVSLFLESCDKARSLVEAERQLNARPPLWDQAMNCYGDLLDLGLDTRDQLKRAATGYYLAACHEKDAPCVQRWILAGLETWVADKPQEVVLQVRRQDLMQEVARLRATAGEQDAPAGGSGGCPNESKGGGHNPQEGGKSEA
jgi:hypothetical protein